jgi:serine/threonine-protein kinase
MARILIADDSLAIRAVYENMLDYLGHEVISCKDGREALAKFATEHVDLMLLDVQMPYKNGIEVCREIRRQPNGLNVPIIIVSSHQEENDILAGLDAGANDYLLKPVQEGHLIARLKNLLNNSIMHSSDYELVKNQVVIAGRYKIRKVIGCGRHSVVFAVDDLEENNKQKALKLLNGNIEDPGLLADYLNTAKKISGIESENITKIFETGQYSGRCYLVMEYVSGGNLRELFKYRKISFSEAVHIGNDISKAIRDLGDNEIIHFDVKPENIVISEEGHFKLTDFGMLTTRASETIPMNAEIWGTAAYISPEYIDAEHYLSPKSDIYSLGTTLYEGLTGDNPFMSDKPMNSLYRQLNIQPPELSNLNLGIPRELSDIIKIMLAKNPDLRPGPEECIDFFSALMNPIKYPWLLMERAKTDMKYRMEQDFHDTNPIAMASEKAEKALERLEHFKKKAEENSISVPKVKESFIAPDKKIVKIVFLGAACLVIAIYLGVFISSVFGSDDQIYNSKESQGPVTIISCPKCDQVVKKRCKDVSLEKCPECSSPMVLLMECRKCNKKFPAKKEYYDKQDGKVKCPYCESKNTTASRKTQ